MTYATDLDEISAAASAYIKSCGMRLFRGSLLLNETGAGQVIWDPENDDWKSYVDIAKEEGARTIILDAEKGEDKHSENIGSLTLAWMKEGVAYLFVKQTEWWRELVEKESEMAGRVPSVSFGVDGEDRTPKEVLKELETKGENELADEILKFVAKEFPDADRIGYRSTELYWEQLGVHRWSLDPKLRLKIEKVDALARQKLEQERLKKEKEQIEKEKSLLPGLVQECLDWARKNQLRRVTKSNIDYFIVEKDLGLSKISRDALYNQVNIKLQKP